MPCPTSLARSRVVLVALSLGLLAPRVAAAQVSGTVVEAETLEPMPGVRVSVQASDDETVTDADGAFELPLATGDVVVVAAAQGYFYAGLPATAPLSGLELALEPVPEADDPDYTFPSPAACSTCHPAQYAQWQESPMAQAGSNRWVYDTYDGSGTPGGMGGFVYTRDSVHAPDNPASECRSCHQPEPWINDLGSALEPIDALSSESLHGISCVVCHQTAAIDETKPSFPGMWPGVVSFRRPFSAAPVMFGALGDVDFTSPGVMRASYQPQLPSAVCAACHQDSNDPDQDGDFEEPDGVISEPTYLEWLASPYADPESPSYATCAGCHMPVVDNPSACVVLPEIDRPLGDIREHTFRGTSPDFLEQAVTLSLETSATPGELTAVVTIDNDKTGHHVPTGVTIRNAILVVEATLAADGSPLTFTGEQRVHELGGVGDPAEGYFAGLPGKLYAKLNHDQNGEGPTFFTDATGITFDTRIPALEQDVTSYTFAVPEGGEVEVRARLVYRRSWRALVDAKGWTSDGHDQPLADLEPPYFGHLMGAAEASLVVDPPSDGGGGGGGGSEGGGGGEGGEAGGPDSPSGGCDCRAQGSSTPSGGALLGLGLALWLGARARQRRR